MTYRKYNKNKIGALKAIRSKDIQEGVRHRMSRAMGTIMGKTNFRGKKPTECFRLTHLKFIIKTHQRGRRGGGEWKEHQFGRIGFLFQFWY